MRLLLRGFVIAIFAAVPALALADNQQMAEQIAQKLRTSGQLSAYKIGIKYQDGTVWVRGRVASQEQMYTALKLIMHTAGVERVVNELSIAPTPVKENEPLSYNPLRSESVAGGQQTRQVGLVKRLENALRSNFAEETPQPTPLGQPVPVRADRLPDAFVPEQAAVSPVAAEEPQELPRKMTSPRQARPMGTAAPTRVAMNQFPSQGQMSPNGGPLPMYTAAASRAAVAPTRYDQPCLPNYAWPSYAAYPNYAAVTYPRQYSPTAWPYIGPFYPYPQVPLGWRKVTLEWDDGWWFLDFKDQPASAWHR